MAGRPPTFPDHELRAKIDDAATQVFAENGYEAATIDKIVALAGVRKPSLYRLYDSKQALYIHLIEDFTTAAASAAMQARPSPTDRGPGLFAMIDAWFRVVESNAQRWRLANGNPPNDPAIVAKLDRIRQMQLANDVTLLKVLAPALPEVEIEPIAEVIRASLIALGQWWLDHPDEPRASPVAAMVRLCQGILLTTVPKAPESR